MANPNLFRSTAGQKMPPADVVNEAGGRAYKRPPKECLAQLACTGCFGDVFYASAEEQLAEILALARACEPEYVAKVALYARQTGLKDTPALLLSHLTAVNVGLAGRIFDRVVDNVRELRTWVQIHRSGVAGRKSFGTAPRRWIRRWFDSRSDDALFRSSIGDKPSLGDIIRMTHPKPATDTRKALYRYLIGKELESNTALPTLVREYLSFSAVLDKGNMSVPHVPYQLLEGFAMSPAQWTEIAGRMSYHQLRQNLLHLLRKGGIDVNAVAARLRDREELRKAKPWPYQLLMTYRATASEQGIAQEITLALQDALDIATENVPEFPGRVVICPDVSGSMRSPVTGYRGKPTQVQCVDVAGLFASAILRKNSLATVIPFSENAIQIRLNPRDSVLTNAEKLGKLGGGGTNCSAPLRLLNDNHQPVDSIIYISDNQSWMDNDKQGWQAAGATYMMNEFARLLQRCPKAKLVCIDLQAYGTRQAAALPGVLNVGGFSDRVFDVVHAFLTDNTDWVSQVEKMEI